jgi:L-ascorbate metabolism protein UlaG (beta-lactamase superfamily)
MTRSLTWLGQAGFLLEIEGLRILIDPFLSEHDARFFPPPRIDPFTEGIDWLLVTHEHLDHLDVDFLPVLAGCSPDVTVVLPTPIVEQAARLVGGVRVVGVQPGNTVELSASVSLSVLPAWHGVEIADAYSDGRGEDGLARFVGYLVEAPGLSLYHSGDTLVTDGLRDALTRHSIDVALLPINGRDYYREGLGLIGNMDDREAVQLALECGVRLLVPMHWDLFRGNTVRPGNAVDEAAGDSGLHVLVPSRFAALPLPDFGSR